MLAALGALLFFFRRKRSRTQAPQEAPLYAAYPPQLETAQNYPVASNQALASKDVYETPPAQVRSHVHFIYTCAPD